MVMRIQVKLRNGDGKELELTTWECEKSISGYL